MAKALDLTEKVFGRLTALYRSGKSENGSIQWRCVCSCGNEKDVIASSLNSGLVSSCGCLYKESRKDCNKSHGMSRTREYNAWTAMRQRCYYAKHDYYSRYGGRGITVCDEWKDDFAKFYEDMGNCPEGMSIERVDNSGNYCKENCKWETPSRQGFNTEMHSNNVSGKTGVHWHGVTGKWAAAIGVEGKSIHLGVFDLFEDAVVAREKAENKYYGRIKN